jgi:hypothetical protein
LAWDCSLLLITEELVEAANVEVSGTAAETQDSTQLTILLGKMSDGGGMLSGPTLSTRRIEEVRKRIRRFQRKDNRLPHP